jgi:hypothetical protein
MLAIHVVHMRSAFGVGVYHACECIQLKNASSHITLHARIACHRHVLGICSARFGDLFNMHASREQLSLVISATVTMHKRMACPQCTFDMCIAHLYFTWHAHGIR